MSAKEMKELTKAEEQVMRAVWIGDASGQFNDLAR